MNPFIKYIEDVLHIKPDVSEYANQRELPLYLRGNYDINVAAIQGISFLLIYPKERTNLTTIRKQANQLKKLAAIDCVICLNSIGAYTKDKMLFEAIPFIIPGKQLYLPFLGVALSENNVREIPYIEKLSFSTQKLLLIAIYQNWTQSSLKEAAYTLGVSKMSISRSFDELQSVGIDLVSNIGKTRCFSWQGKRWELWDVIKPFLRNPVKRQYRLGELITLNEAKLGGISALCHYSMLADNPYSVYAITKNAAKPLESAKLITIPDTEVPVMVIQVMQYDLDYRESHAIDPLSAILSVSEEDKADPRVDAAIDEIMEDLFA